MGAGTRWIPAHRSVARAVGTVIAVSLVVALVSHASPARAVEPPRPVVFGAFPASRAGQTRTEAVQALEAQIGRKLEVVRVFDVWETPFPDSFHRFVRDGGRTPLLSIKPVRNNGTRVTWASIANAQPGSQVYDEIRSWATRIRDYGGPIYVTLHHEPEASSNTNYGNASDFIAAWRRWVDIFRSVGVPNAHFMWIMTDYAFMVPTSDRRHAPKWFPGDEWIDGMAIDAYNWFTCRPNADNPWRSLEQIIEPFRQFGLQHPTKELWLTEWASWEDPATPGRKARWIDDARALFARPSHQQFVGISYFNSDHPSSNFPDCEWWVDSSAASLTSFRAMGLDPLYQGATPGTPPPNQQPVAAFTSDCIALRCTFDATASTDPDGTIAEHRWNFGDTTTATGTTPAKDYSQPGTYTVTLTVTDDEGATATASLAVTVLATPPANAPPTAGFVPVCTGLSCTFDASASTDPDGTITSYTWQLGDGTTVGGVTPGHVYPATGTYTVQLSVTDDDGATASASRNVTVAAPAPLPPSLDTSRLVTVVPERVFDTRPGEPAAGPKGVVPPGETIDVKVAGAGGVPADATAVVLNLAAVGLEAGFVSAWPTGTDRPASSNLNIVHPGQVRSNLVIVPVGTGGMISLFTLGEAHLLGDVTGYFVPQTTPTRAGRIVTQTPGRLFDTRPGPDPGPKGTLAADSTIDVQVLGEAGLPDSGVSAVVLNLTAAAPHGPGFVTAWSGATPRPTTSSININAAFETVPNQVIVPIGPAGTIRLYTSVATDLLADVSGYVTDSSSPPSLAGLFVPIAPERLFDTRPGEPAAGPKGVVPAGATITPAVAGVGGVSPAAGAVVLNITMVGTTPGFSTAWPADAARPTTSIVNVDGDGDVRANGAILALGDGGDLSLFASSSAHLLADVSGYITR